MNIGKTVEALNKGWLVKRDGWEDRWLALLIAPSPVYMDAKAAPLIVMRSETGDMVPWQCTQADLLADDWTTIDT